MLFEEKMYNFFALLSRMKLIERWSLMRSTKKETLMEHSAEVAILAQALAVINNEVFSGNADIFKTATYALYHDTSEVLSGDLPTPVKYFNPVITSAYHNIENQFSQKLLSMLPDKVSRNYKDFFNPDLNSIEYKFVKIADKLSAYLKCIEEKSSGNKEFEMAEISIKQKLDNFKCPELDYFFEHFVEGYGKPLDMLK